MSFLFYLKILDKRLYMIYNAQCKVFLLYKRCNMQIEEHNNLIELFDLYGSLLSKKQFEVMDKFLNFDLGESELGAELGESRQSVHDAITKAKRQLYEFEEKCKINAKLQEIRSKLVKVSEKIEKNSNEASNLLEKVIKNL